MESQNIAVFIIIFHMSPGCDDTPPSAVQIIITKAIRFAAQMLPIPFYIVSIIRRRHDFHTPLSRGSDPRRFVGLG